MWKDRNKCYYNNLKTSRSNLCKLQQWYLVRLWLAYNKNYWWEIMFLVPYDAYNWKNTRNIHWLKDASSIWMSMLTQFYSPVSMNPTMTFSWFSVDSPGTSPSALVDKPMKSQEWVVCSLLFVLGNTETTPGISEEMNIGFKFRHHITAITTGLTFRVPHTYSKSHVWRNYQLISWLVLCSV